MRLRGGDSARRVLRLTELGFDGLVDPFSDEVFFGERVGLIGPNGSGKSHVIRVLAGDPVPHSGDVTLGPRVSPGYFTQLNLRPDFAGRTTLDPIMEITGGAGDRDARPGPLRPCGRRAPAVRDAVGRPEGAAGDPLPRARGPQPPAARRADRQPRHRLVRGARVRARRVRGHGRRRRRTTAPSCAGWTGSSSSPTPARSCRSPTTRRRSTRSATPRARRPRRGARTGSPGRSGRRGRRRAGTARRSRRLRRAPRGPWPPPARAARA